MITDVLATFSNAQSLAAASTVVSTDVMDLSVGGAVGAIPQLIGSPQGRDMAGGEDFDVAFTFPSAAGAAITFQVITSASSAMTSPTVVASTGSIPAAELTAGRNPIVLCVNPSAIKAQAEGQRYLAVQYVTGAGAASVVSAAVINDTLAFAKYYRSGYTVV